jgi:protease I
MGAVDKNKVLGAICISPVILAKAGVLKNKKATVWASPLDRSPIKILEENGAEFVDEKAVRDEKIVTGNGPDAAKEFAEVIIEALDE